MSTNGVASRGWLCLLASSLIALPVLADDGWVAALPALVKVRPGNIPPGTTSVSISAARGECTGVQIVAVPPADSVDAIAVALTGPGGSLMPTLYREGWINVVYPTIQGAPGPWPDPLIPVVDGYAGERRNALPYSSTVQLPLVLYVELCVPASQTPGTYRGEVQLTARDRNPASVPIVLEVQPFEIPATSSLPNTFGISILTLAPRHGMDPRSPTATQLLQRYGRALLAHRISPHGMSFLAPRTTFDGDRAVVDFTDYDLEMGPFLDGHALPSGAKFSTAEVRELPEEGPQPTDNQRVSYYQAFRDHFRDKGWSAKLIYYTTLMDEPEYQGHIAEARVRAALVHRVPGIQVTIADGIFDELMGAFDIMSVPINCLYPRDGLASCAPVYSPDQSRALIGPRAELWHYQACLSFGCGADTRIPEIFHAYSNWASYAIDHPGTRNRAMGPLAFISDMKGELYFDTAIEYREADPWEDMSRGFNQYPGGVAGGANGEGTLFYPGTPSRIGGQTHIPIESLRLKLLRDGLQDYEYFHLLASLEGNDRYAKSAARRLLQSGYEINPDLAEWARVRADLTARILEFVAPSGAGYTMSPLPARLVAGQSATFTVTAVDAHGNVRTDYNGTLRVRSSDPQAILPPVQQLVNGVARDIPITLKTAGAQTVIAEDQVYPFNAARTIQVDVASLSEYRIDLAGTSTAGQRTPFALRATDAHGNTVSQYSGTAFLRCTDARAEYPERVSFSNGVAGNLVAVFKAAGSQTLIATDPAGVLGLGWGPIVIAPGPPARYRLTPLSDPAIAARYTTFSVDTVDAFGNPVTNYAGTATLTSSDPNAVFPPTAAFFRGIVPNLHVTFYAAGEQAITLRDRVDPQLQGEGRQRVVGGSAVKFDIVGLPQTTYAKVQTRFSIVARDAHENVASSYTGPIRVTSTDPRASFSISAFNSGTAEAKVAFQNQGEHSVVVVDPEHGSLRGEASTSVGPKPAVACSSSPSSPTLLLLFAYLGLCRFRAKRRRSGAPRPGSLTIERACGAGGIRAV